MIKNIAKGFALAVSMLTIIPFFRVHDFYKGINGYAVMFYPFVGFLLGAILWGVYTLLAPYISAFHLGIIIFGMWVLLSGALHLDGFSDTVDGLFVQKDRALKVMKDPNIGGMGMIFGVTFLILKASSLAAVEAMYLLPLVLMLSRFNAVLAIYFYPYVSPNGMSTLAKEELKGFQVLVAFVYVLAITFMLTYALGSAAAVLLCSLLVLFVIKIFFMKRYGGFTGDIYGFTIELTELVLLNVIIVTQL